jgi:Pyrimidine dimer DNA glycosylase
VNIFAVDQDPDRAAVSLCDKHVVKMPLETAQMLCSVSWRFDVPAPYKQAYAKHPCTLWAGETLSNWTWLVEHGIALCAEYERRYNRKHASSHPIAHCALRGGRPSGSRLTPFAQAMPVQYKQADDAVAAYRAYYLGEKASFACWKSPASPPEWWPSLC